MSLFVQDESMNPYGTWKDRRSEYIVQKALKEGISKLCLITSGNAGYSLARYAELQNILQMNPEIGDLIQNTGGARKVRMALPGKGKSGGARVIYYLKMKKAIYFLDIYPKSKKNDLTHAERNLVAEIVADLKNEFRKKTL